MGDGIAYQYVVAVTHSGCPVDDTYGSSQHVHLHEHHQRVQHVQSYSLCLTSRTSSEARATQSILLLVASFTTF